MYITAKYILQVTTLEGYIYKWPCFLEENTYLKNKMSSLERLTFSELPSWGSVSKPDHFEEYIRSLTDTTPKTFGGGYRGGRYLGGDTLTKGGGLRGGYDFDRTLGIPSRGTSLELPKPEILTLLETVLSEVYGKPVEVTCIRNVQSNRKEVKEVYFKSEDKTSRVWVFKADPKTTAKELALYSLLTQKGITTGKPLGYNPEDPHADYPYDVAILGGVVEHAGDSYNDLLKDLMFKPDSVHAIAKMVLPLIADYQVKLTLAKPEILALGIELNPSSPQKEIRERLVAALKESHTEEQAEKLIQACEKLYSLQSGSLLVSHGDLHLGNIVTLKEGDRILRDHFGFIDWATLCLDHAYGDVASYVIHHQRQAKEVCILGYKFEEHTLMEEYQRALTDLALPHGISLSGHPERDAQVQQVLWHIYEIADPTRKGHDARKKTQYHLVALSELFPKLEASQDEDLAKGVLEVHHELKSFLASGKA
jgi:hypothetical protein